MKRFSLGLILTTLVINVLGKETPLSFSYPGSVDLFGLYEISFTLPTVYSNPYDPDVILAYGVFEGPDNSTYTVNAFYYECYSFQQHNNGYEVATHNSTYDGWRIRFTPTQTGTWRFKIRVFDANGELDLSFTNVYYTFSCNPISNGVGFISKANTRFLKRDVVKNGQRQFHSFFPIGPNVAWYSCKVEFFTPPFSLPYGIYEYEHYIDSLDGNANYMRIWLNRFQYLSLFGPEYTQTGNNNQPIVYFDNTVNQKDSAELDYIIKYALQHGVSVMPCIFNYGPFRYSSGQGSNDWSDNPFNSVVDFPCEFFTDVNAIKITKNLIRYIISRWGYATNVMCWEFWNEVDHMFDMCYGYKHIEQDVCDWHEEMAEYVRSIDPFKHLVSTSLGSANNHFLFSVLYNQLDFVQAHNYQNIRNAESRNQLLYRLFNKTNDCFSVYPTKPFFMGEFGFGQGQDVPLYEDKDPYGVDLHNSLWSSLFFSSVGPASFWWWPYVDTCDLYHRFTPLLNFCQNLPILSETFTSHHTGEKIGHELVFPNNLEVYYMTNSSQDTIYGWSQDTAFAYQSMLWLTDSAHVEITQWGPALFFKKNGVFDSLGYVYTLNPAKRPAPSSNSNIIEIPITNQPVGSRYRVTWYNSETGLAYSTGVITYANVQLNGAGNKVVSFTFPSFIRNLQQQTINNTFGDAVFSLVLDNLPSDKPFVNEKNRNNTNIQSNNMRNFAPKQQKQ